MLVLLVGLVRDELLFEWLEVVEALTAADAVATPARVAAADDCEPLTISFAFVAKFLVFVSFK